MSSNRDLFFKLKNANYKYVKESVINQLLYEANGVENLTDFVHLFREECKDEKRLWEMVERVEKGEPIQYVTGKAQFLDWVLNVNQDVLIPRVETEELAANILKILKETGVEKYKVCDVCTGSGALAIAVKNRFPKFDVSAIDISDKALAVARQNACKYHADINFIQGDLIDPLIEKGEKIDVLICNPPYISDKSTIDEQVWKYEPHLALMAEPAWKFYERIFQYYKFFMAKEFVMFFEIGEDMEQDLTNLMNINMDKISFIFRKDMYGKTRFLIISGVNEGGMLDC